MGAGARYFRFVSAGLDAGALFEQQLNAWRGGVCGAYSAEFADDAKGGYFIEGGTMGPAMGGQQANTMDRA